MKHHVRAVIDALQPVEREAVHHFDEHWGRGPKHLVETMGVSLSGARDICRTLRRHGVLNYGALWGDDDGLVRGRGHWLDSFGRAVRNQLKKETPAVNIAPPIGLSGYACAGKTTAAQFIEAMYGYKRQHIAEPLRRMLASLLREYGYNDAGIERYLTGDLKETVIPELGVTSRHCQITLGTEWGRELINPNIWANLWAYQAQGSDRGIMNDSVRFQNEESAIHSVGGFTIRIDRPGTGPAAFKWKRFGPLLLRWFGCHWGVHDSERIDRLKPDYVIVNDGTLRDLGDDIRELMRLRLSDVST